VLRWARGPPCCGGEVFRVTAIAPTPLYPWLMYDPEVQYQPLRAEDYLPRCNATFALIVNDMKLDAQDSARLMVEYARHLRSEGIAIMTLKLRERNQQRVMDHAFRLLRKTYKIIRVRQLVSNHSEVTLFLRRKP
jgi:23S rRNA (cytidine2498-2'-O)-methyltransferase